MSHDASATTASANSDVAARLNLEDAADLERVRHGRLGGLERLVVRHDKHDQPILDTADWDFLDDAAPPSVNPSLWRQARLNP